MCGCGRKFVVEEGVSYRFYDWNAFGRTENKEVSVVGLE